MKKKITAYVFAALCLAWLFFRIPLSGPKTPVRPKPISSQNKVIVAPAIIDSLNDITRIPTLQQGLMKTIAVRVGQKVKKGQLLFSLDSTLAENSTNIYKIILEQSKNRLLIQEKTLKHARYQLARLKSLDKRAISQAEMREKSHEVKMGEAQVTQAQHNLALAESKLNNAELRLNQFNVVAPKDGIVLQINAHVNEFVQRAQPIMLLGDANKIMVRVSIDARDSQRFHPTAAAYLTSNENPALNIPLTFMQLDRYIVTLERVNSRVQEALYYFNRNDYPNLVAGQEFDANIPVS